MNLCSMYMNALGARIVMQSLFTCYQQIVHCGALSCLCCCLYWLVLGHIPSFQTFLVDIALTLHKVPSIGLLYILRRY